MNYLGHFTVSDHSINFSQVAGQIQLRNMGVVLDAADMGKEDIPTDRMSVPQHLVSHRTTNISQSPLQERVREAGGAGRENRGNPTGHLASLEDEGNIKMPQKHTTV